MADTEPVPQTMICEGDLTFAALTAINTLRCARWHPGYPHDTDWTGADWSNAMCGEAGEAANVVKKLRRAELAVQGALDAPPEELVARLGEELADTVIYLDLLATKYGVHLPDAVVEKFNAVSVREGFPERLAVVSAWRTIDDVEALELNPHDVIVLRTGHVGWSATDAMGRMAKAIYEARKKKGWENTIVVITPEADISAVDEAFMAEHGWIRAPTEPAA